MKTILLTSAGMNMKDEIVKILPKPAGEAGLWGNENPLKYLTAKWCDDSISS